jgi:AmmeMemoRadiSam system protein B
VVQCLQASSEADTIVLFGRHLHPGSSRYIMLDGEWETPLGALPIDEDMASRLAREFPFEMETATRYGQDNTIELQLPFVRYFFPEAMIVPIGVPPEPASLEIGRRAVELAEESGKRLLVLGSTDLTHYGPNYGFSPKGTGPQAVEWVRKENDRQVIDRMLAMDEEGVLSEGLQSLNACCAGAAATTIAAARRMGAQQGVELAYTTSYDIRPDSSFVGYVGVLF